ncbi:NAD(P)-dependent oxidoreductase [Fundidesulfovibrio butyratiphilus]
MLHEAFSGSRALVAGGGGFIGKALTARLRALGARTDVLGLRPGPDRLALDLRDRQALARGLEGRDYNYVFNLGGYINHAPMAKGGLDVLDTHLGGAVNLIAALSGHPLKGFVQVGSSDEYGQSPAPQREDMREAPFSPYSAAKTAVSHLVQALARTEGFPGSVVRYFLVYGPGQDSARFLPQIIRGALEDREFPTSLGGQLRDFCYIDDAVEGALLAACRPQARGEVFNIASGRPVSIREMIDTVVGLVGTGRPQFGAHPYRPGENMALWADVEKAKRLLGFQARVGLAEGLGLTIAHFREMAEDR